MKLSISNIAWESERDPEIYKLIKEYGYCGLEIAPTRIFSNTPYEKISEAVKWKDAMYNDYELVIPSMQSIWFGRQEKIFGSVEERDFLIKYTKKAIDFASAIGCQNIVFGCPRNRVMPENADLDIAISFFKEVGAYAVKNGTVIGLEANPPIYNTNFINDTLTALELIKQVNSEGFLLNLDTGTMIQNGEDIEGLVGQIRFVNHVHVSEPGLQIIRERRLHKKLNDLLRKEKYNGFVSIEMGKTGDVASVTGAMKYVGEVFH
jgi:sugar phosphate isomerase/epimerase